MLELHLEVLRPPQRQLWDVLQKNAAMIRGEDFLLAGGTALALQIGHRESKDFDFFSRKPGVAAVRHWVEELPMTVMRDVDQNTLHAEVAGIKLSFITGYRYPFLESTVTAGELAMASILDIALMKMLAITHRATIRDYLDLAVILRDHCTLAELIEKSTAKYGPNFNVMLVLRAMVHFDDLDEEMPVILDSTLTSDWRRILHQAVKSAA